MKPVVAARFARILRAFDRAASSVALSHLPKAEMPAQDQEFARLFDAD
jgi:hypothetical protein